MKREKINQNLLTVFNTTIKKYYKDLDYNLKPDLDSVQLARHLGVLETYLSVLDVLPDDGQFKYLEVPETHSKKTTFRKEHYHEYIIRNCKTYLRDINLLKY